MIIYLIRIVYKLKFSCWGGRLNSRTPNPSARLALAGLTLSAWNYRMPEGVEWSSWIAQDETICLLTATTQRALQRQMQQKVQGFITLHKCSRRLSLQLNDCSLLFQLITIMCNDACCWQSIIMILVTIVAAFNHSFCSIPGDGLGYCVWWLDRFIRMLSLQQIQYQTVGFGVLLVGSVPLLPLKLSFKWLHPLGTQRWSKQKLWNVKWK